jgi:arsenite methyltransferase
MQSAGLSMQTETNASQTLDSVKEYYGKVLQTNQDLKTTACCAAESVPASIQDTLRLIHPTVKEKFYGCGFPVPPLLEGCTVLDLGSGAGRDSFLLSKLVGPSGRVIGVDMTDEQLSVAREFIPYHMDKFGFREPNVHFVKGYIEDLQSAGVESNSVDVVISNCVTNLSPDKRRVFREVLRVLKPGGELYFSDIFSNRRIPESLAQDPVLRGECLGGALYTEDFRRLMAEEGIRDFRAISKTSVQLTNPEVVQKIGMVNFASITFRVFKLPTLEDKCEDYGQVAFYQGTVPGNPHTFMLDDHHIFKTGVPMLVCSNTASMLQDTRYGKHFQVHGDTSTHYGLFDCGPTLAVASNLPGPAGACC